MAEHCRDFSITRGAAGDSTSLQNKSHQVTFLCLTFRGARS
jgi:hypothetical protein